ncbi:hypothetical protein E1263_25975 [Kribbella antibiotica]|uniref:Uncharacterized protein n=1 Tax=Kribbella antibiotica TaxID=190195 RepID=A0A4R4ZBT7_9ACTN|nr:hypothetical protein [Kribbella antibiotica]TDD55725.1 hypothetical protein E1263_25975 [Kribbella antibiotica]
MNKFGIVAALAGAGALLVGGTLPSTAAVASSNSQAASSPVFVKRYFANTSPGHPHAGAYVPKTWKHQVLAPWQDKFADAKHNQMIRFNSATDTSVSTTQAMKRKVAALKHTRGLKVVSTSTASMKSTSGQGPLTISTVVYTYRSGKTTRWVADRFIGLQGVNYSEVEVIVGGAPKDYKYLGTVLLNGTRSLQLGS